MVQQPIPIQESRLLLVEGKDESNFFDALIRHLELRNLQIMEVGGKDQFRRKLQDITMQSNFEEVTSIGIVRDSDGEAKSAFDSICSALKASRLPVPAKVLMPTIEAPRIAVLIMPPNDDGTMLEDLCLASATNDPALECVDQYFACLAEQSITLKDNVIAKARVHAFLASRPDPDKRLGEAAQASYWNWDSPVFDKVKTFLQEIATIENESQ